MKRSGAEKRGNQLQAQHFPGFETPSMMFAHDFVLSILCLDHGDADCYSVCMHVSGGQLSLLSEL